MSMFFYFLIAYLSLQILIGFWVSKKVKNEGDYLVAGRNLPTILVTFSLFATWFGAETCIGTSGAVFAHGLSGSRADPFGYSLCLFLTGLLLASRLWSGEYTTLADFYKKRFGSKTEKIAVAILVPSALIWGAAQLRAFGQVISATTAWPVEATITVAFVFVVVYTLLGGLLGDMITDLIQGGVIAIGLLVLLAVILFQDISWDLVFSQPERLSFKAADESIWQRVDRWMIPIFGSLVAQELIARILSARNAKVARNSSYIAGIIYLFLGSIPVVLGLLGPQLLPELGDQEQFLIVLAKTYLSPLAASILIGALLSAILATIDSILLSGSALLSHNIFVPLLKIKSEKQKLNMARGFVVLSAMVSYILALYSTGIYDLVETASSFGTAGVLIITLMGLWTSMGNEMVAISCLFLGIILMPFNEYILKVPAPFTATLLFVLFSYLFLSFSLKKQSYA